MNAGTLDIDLHLLLGPITSLAVCGNKVIAGCGNEIAIYCLVRKSLESRHEIFKGASVHGLKRGPLDGLHRQLLCAFGEKKVCVFALTNCTPETTAQAELAILAECMEVEDWIWDAKWLKSEGLHLGTIALALAHNCVLHWDWQNQGVVARRCCSEKCILYCAHFIGEIWSYLILAAGTVFNQVVLWPVSARCDGDSSTVGVSHVLSGHKGVIFSICYRADLQKLASASDDRSIMIWLLKLPSNPSDWDKTDSSLLFCVFGHSARVWQVWLLTDSFASVGEDATAIIWDYEGNIIQKLRGHKGRSIWSMTTTDDEKHLLTGGGDASIRIWDIKRSSETSISQKTFTIPPTLNLDVSDFPRSVCMVGFDVVLIMMNSGCLVHYNMKYEEFTTVFNEPAFYSYSVLKAWSGLNAVAVGNIGGSIRIVFLSDDKKHYKFTDQQLFSGKILSLCWLSGENILASGPNGKILLLKIRPPQDTGISTPSNVEIVRELLLPPSKHRWISAGCQYPKPDGEGSHLLNRSSMLVCGDKNGSVHCYDLSQSPVQCEEGLLLQPHQSFYQAHGKAGVTSVQYHEGAVYTTGRDGCYTQWRVTDSGINLLHRNKVLKGFEWIDHLEWHNGDLLVIGFYSSQFVVWSVPYNQQVLSVQCGGGHRSWSCALPHLSSLRFVYVKSGAIHVVDSSSHTKQTILQPALHGRELCDAKIVGNFSKDNLTPPWMVICTASEDTTINIGLLCTKNGLCTMETLAILKGHLSSIRTLSLSPSRTSQSSESTASRVLLFSGGGRAELKAWALTFDRTSHDHKDSFRINQNLPCQTDKSKNPHRTSSPTSDSEKTELQKDFENDDDDDDQLTKDLVHKTSVQWQNAAIPVSKQCGYDHQEDNAEVPKTIQCSYEHLCTHFLGESRHKRSHSSWKSHKLRLDPETRIMCLASTAMAEVLQNGGAASDPSPSSSLSEEELSGVYLVSAAGSDGILRLFSFHEISRQFSPVCQSDYHRGCVLKVHHHLQHRDGGRNLLLLLSASTNGQILIWNLGPVVSKMVRNAQKSNTKTELEKNKSGWDDFENHRHGDLIEDDKEEKEDDDDYVDFTSDSAKPKVDNSWQPICSMPSHQSGVNSLHSLQVSGSQLLVASGGDDNCLTVQLIQIQGAGVTCTAQVKKTDAHATQITGVKLVTSTLVVTTSIDQRVSVWRILHADHNQLQLEMVACKYINVADVSNMDVCVFGDSMYLLIAGEGICLCSIHHNDCRS